MNVYGLVSGMDTAALIQAVNAAQRVPINQIESRKGGVQTQISKLGEVSGKLGELKSMMEDMLDGQGLVALNSTSSDEDVLTAIATGIASPGTYDLDVSQLAVAEKDRSVGFGSTFSEVQAGTLTIQTAGSADTFDITIDEGDVLEEVVAKINGSGAAVHASIVFDGTNHFLQLVAEESGHIPGGAASDAITITESYSGASGTALGFSEVVTAQNAAFSLDGLSVTSRTNAVTDVVEGLTIDLVSTGAASLTVSADKEGTKENLQAFVDGYNDLSSFLRDEVSVTEGESRQSSLASDSVIRALRTELSTIISNVVPDLQADGAFSALAHIGIVTDSTGKLKIDEDTLDETLAGDLTAVTDIFNHTDAALDAQDQGIATRILDLVERYVEGGIADVSGSTVSYEGLLKTRTDSLNDRVDRMNERIERMEDRVDTLTLRMERQFSAMEQAMQQFQAQGSSLMSLLA